MQLRLRSATVVARARDAPGGAVARRSLKACGRMPSLASRALALVVVAALAIVAAVLLLGGGGGGGGGRGRGGRLDPFGYRPGAEDDARRGRGTRQRARALREAARRRARERRAHRALALADRAAADSAGVEADELEGLVLLESAGRDDAIADPRLEGAVGLTQILAETGRNLLKMRVDPAAARRIGRSLARAERRGDERAGRAPARAAHARRRALRPGEGARRDRALPADRQARARPRRPRDRQLPHGHRQPPERAARLRRRRHLLRAAVLRLHAAAQRGGLQPAGRPRRRLRDLPLAGRARRGRSCACTAPIPTQLDRVSALQNAKNSAEEVLHPGDETERFETPAQLRAAYDDGRDRRAAARAARRARPAGRPRDGRARAAPGAQAHACTAACARPRSRC